MKSESQSPRLGTQRGQDFGRDGSNFGASPPVSGFRWNHMLVFAVAILVLVCLALPVCGQSESGAWGILAVHEKEYTSNDTPKDIPGVGTETSTLTIEDTGAISDVNVKVNITHPYDADLDVYLIAPDGTRIELFTDVGVLSEDFVDTILDNEASQSITDGRGPFTGSYRPEGDLTVLNGKNVEGTWTLEVTDDWGLSRVGTLNAWSLIATIGVAEPLAAPVIQAEASVPGDILDTIFWDDLGGITQYDCNTPEAIPDQGTLASELVIDDAGTIEDLNVLVNISHPLDSDVDVFLVAPDGQTRIELFTDVGASGDDFEDTILDDEAPTPITEGSAPFAGSYRPEGNLSELIGKNICGTWTLEVSDDSYLSSGTLNSWSLIADLADVAYDAQCAGDADFSNIAADSGWMTNTSYTFTGLNQGKKYWYRAKARPIESWFQTDQPSFEKGTLTDTQATEQGDVTLAGGGGGTGSELHVITSPGFESLDGWSGGATTPDIVVGRARGMWESEGQWAGITRFSFDNSFYFPGDFGFLVHSVDLTGVDALVFDWASWGFADLLEAAVFIGDTQVWDGMGTDASIYPPDYISAKYDESIDVSAFEGVQDLGLVVYSMMFGPFDAAILWDNLRTYGPAGYDPAGQIVSTRISIGEADTWGVLSASTTTPNGTELTLDILPAEGSDPIPGYADIPSGTDISDLVEKTIRLRANLSTSDGAITPILHDWSITYTDAARESEWSNVVSSKAN
jgi:subtilisin-like proprotein convertase family protein